jgi:hypothetical protein
MTETQKIVERVHDRMFLRELKIEPIDAQTDWREICERDRSAQGCGPELYSHANTLGEGPNTSELPESATMRGARYGVATGAGITIALIVFYLIGHAVWLYVQMRIAH